MDAFKKANLKSMLAIEKSTKEELFKPKNENEVRQRNKRDKEAMVKMSSNVTDQLLNISRQLAETTKQVIIARHSKRPISLYQCLCLFEERPNT